MVFCIVTYECENSIMKKAEFLLWTERRSNQPVLEKVNPEYSLEGLMLKLKLWYFGHLMQRADSLEKILMLRKIENRRRGWQRIKWFDGVTDSMDMSLLKLWEIVKNREDWHAAVNGVTQRVRYHLATEQQQSYSWILDRLDSTFWFLTYSFN